MSLTDAKWNGAILEAAFVDPAYTWPPQEGQGRYAVELEANDALLDGTDGDLAYPEPPRIKGKKKIVTETETFTVARFGVFKCCKTEEQVINTHVEREPIDEDEKERLKMDYINKRNEVKDKRKARREEKFQKEKYSRVPDGVLIYRLDTASRTITLISAPNSNSNMKTLMTEMVVRAAEPSKTTSRRGIMVTSVDGEKIELVACEQRSATAWLEALTMMLGKGSRGKNLGKFWNNLSSSEKNAVEEQYLNLTNYSNDLIRTGAIPSHNGKKKTTGGIYYTVSKKHEDGEDMDEETLESVAKRRAVIKDSWDFYRMVCSLLRDRRKYDEVFRRLQMSPVYPYLNSMTGLNDPGDDSGASEEVVQEDLAKYGNMSRTAVCNDLIKKAEQALPSLVEICKALAGSLGMEEIGVGPVKEVSSAIRKAEKRYGGNVLHIKDFCRALVVVKDFETLLALLELARDSFGPLIRRVKLSSLKSDHEPLPGGYRDCKINLELKGHICEIQVHVWPFWVICGVDGFRHYRHCLEYEADTFKDAYDTLVNLDSKTLAELIVMSEEAVAGMPLDGLNWYHEKYILDYFAEAGLFLDHGLYQWAETTLRQLIKLRNASPDVGPDHSETLYLHRYLAEALRKQNKNTEANHIEERVASVEASRRKKEEDEAKSFWDTVVSDPAEALDQIMDPNKKEREDETKMKHEVKSSKKAWKKIRKQRFRFLDTNRSDSSVATGAQ